MNKINITNIEYYSNFIIIACMIPMSYFAPIGEWLLISILAIFSLSKYIFKPIKINFSNIFLFIIISLIFCLSYIFSINNSRSLEVLGPNLGIIFCIFVILILTSNNKIKKLEKFIGISIFITSFIIICDLTIHTEIRASLASLVGDKPSSESANFSRGILILTMLMPIVTSILYNNKKYIYGTILLFTISTIIIVGPNDSAKIALICSIIAAITIYLFGPRSFKFFGLVSGIIIIFIPLISSKILPSLGKYEKSIEYENKTMAWQETSTGGSVIHRLLVWEFASKEALKKPLFGHGIGTSRLIGQNIILNIPNTNSEIKGGIPLHPHNNFIEIWLELGIIGISIISFIWFKIIKYGYYLRKQSFILGTGACTSIVTMFIICNLSFGFFQAWWMSSLGLIFLIIQQTFSNKKEIT